MELINFFYKLKSPNKLAMAIKQRFLKDEYKIMKWDGQLWCGNPKTNYISTLIYRREAWEPAVAAAFAAEIKAGMTVMDVGAEHGYFTLMAAKRVGPAGKVISFEPIKNNVHKLKTNIHLNRYDNVKIVAAALFSKSGSEYIDKGTQGMIEENPASTDNKEEITLLRGDDLLASARLQVRRIDLIKIDIEGAEVDALFGLKEAVIKYKPVIMIEVHVTFLKNYGRTTDDLFDFFSGINYACEPIDLGKEIFQNTKPADLYKYSSNFHIICKPS